MKVVLYLNTSLNADSKQVIILNKEVLSDSKQIIYANHEKYVDTKFVISAYKTYYTDSAQILYLLKEIVVDSFQLTSILSQMIFTGEISPGQTLRIDTEKMEALVDNLLANNALDKFIELEPGTNFIVIQDDTGNVLVNIEIEYKDRWL
ncbi:phage distal tail protein [Caldanaerobius polysaccharolyticus]|uniref:phage distal tail protein n=1 Tax=Caldanaerobius polysaccharolyticus TaxID=44256 RepID=UPI00146FC41E|nr:phage tail family protein [Caldanaerobius polysaccharolyticus]